MTKAHAQILPGNRTRRRRASIDLRSRRSEQSQQQILAAAEAEFADKGLAGARVDEIAEASGINKQMIYYYYGSKEDLYLAVLERAYAAMRKEERELNLDRSRSRRRHPQAGRVQVRLLHAKPGDDPPARRREHAEREVSEAVVTAPRNAHLADRRAAIGSDGGREAEADPTRHRSGAALLLDRLAQLFLLFQRGDAVHRVRAKPCHGPRNARRARATRSIWSSTTSARPDGLDAALGRKHEVR